MTGDQARLEEFLKTKSSWKRDYCDQPSEHQ